MNDQEFSLISSRGHPNLSKSRFTAGIQCLKRLYLECHKRELADPVSESQQAIFDAGTAVGELARQRFSGGMLVAEPYYDHVRAVETTGTLLAASPGPPLYEAAFTFEGIRIRVDILVQDNDGGFDLLEVKSSTGVKPEHIPDVAIQLYVLQNLGLPINNAYLMHINNRYVYAGGDYNLEELFTLSDVTAQARRFVSDSVPGDLARMWETLQREAPPDIEVGRHCTNPYLCPFFGHCHHSGVVVPGGASGEAVISRNLGAQLAEISYPAGFLDFETFMPALPVYTGTRPYQTIPFQWSLHIQEEDGRLTHREFLNDDTHDPRGRLIVSLLDAVPPRGSIVVYSTYEKRILTELGRDYPRYESELASLRDRLFDLLPIIRSSYHNPALPNNSLKSVVPVLVPGRGYSDLDIQEGSAASALYAGIITEDFTQAERTKIREALLAYCRTDTEALVRVLTALRHLA